MLEKLLFSCILLFIFLSGSFVGIKDLQSKLASGKSFIYGEKIYICK